MPDTNHNEILLLTPAGEEPPEKVSVHPLHSLGVILRNIVLILIGSYGLSVSLHILLCGMVGGHSTIVAFFNTFAHLMWMPALILLPLMVVLKQRHIGATLILPALMFITTYGGSFFPRQPVTLSAPEQIITIQTHNLLASNRTPERIVPIILDISADIVALQEVSVSYEKRLMQLDGYPYKAIHGMDNDGTRFVRETMGQAILSRYPILEDDYWTYDFLPIPLGHQRVVIDVEGQPIVVYNVHLTHPGMTGAAFFDVTFRRREIADLIRRVQSETLPVILLGDFNLSDLNLEYSQITSELIDTHREAGQGMGFSFPDFQEASVLDSTQIIPDTVPAHLPIPLLMRLDYVFHSEEFRGVTTYIYPTSGGSDHRPLVVTLSLNQMDSH